MSVMLEKLAQAVELRRAVRGVQAEEQEAVHGQLQTNDQFSEILVFRQEDSLLTGCHPRDCVIVAPWRDFLDVDDIVTVCTDASHEQSVTTFIREKIHSVSPEATISSFARWSAAKVAAARMSFTVK